MPDAVTERFQATNPAAAVGADTAPVVAESHVAGIVTAVGYTPVADITGANTNSRTLSLINKGTDGNGTTVVATLALTSGVNASDFDELALTLSATAANLVVAKGDVLAFTSVHVGTGIADPGGRVEVELTRTA
jgi:hypothetical protein